MFVSGGATGIGADIVRAFARNRARVAFVDLQREAGDALARELAADGEAPLFLEADVTDIPALQAAIGQTREKLGPIGVLVNNAANDQRHKVAEVSVEYWDQCQNVNLRHHFFAAQAVHPQMRELGCGSIVNMSSIAWRFGAAEMPAYAAAKAGVVGSHARARPRLRPGQHPRQRDRARRRDDRTPAPALVQDARIRRGDGAAPVDQDDVCSAKRSRAPRCSSPPTTAA